MQTLFIVWSDIYATNVHIIDEQHRSIVSTINTLFYFMRKAHGVDSISPTIATLEQYTKLQLFY